ncbi:MAG: TolC family protein [Gammaproteobacteria bacterium]
MLTIISRAACLVALSAYAAHSYAELPAQWDLIKSVREALRQTPQLQAAAAEVEARQSMLDESSAWPNPRVEIAVDDSVSLEQGNTGYAFSELSVTQPIPFGRLDAEKKQARIEVSAAQAQQRYRLLDVEKKTALLFYDLQFRSEILSLAEQRHDSLEKLMVRGKDPLVRYFSETERKRLGILREEAHQAMSAAEGEYNEALSQFRTLLSLPESTDPVTGPLETVPAPQSLDELLAIQAQHPLLISLQLSKQAAEAGIDVSRAQRRVDPELKLFTTRDVYAGKEQNSTGIALMFEIPLWQKNGRKVARARADFQQQQAELSVQQRELGSQLRKSHLHLEHLIEQADHYRDYILQPAKEILQLSQRGFRSGEIDLLNFIDAHNTYYDARSKYLMLVYDGWLETADLRYSAGQMLAEVAP